MKQPTIFFGASTFVIPIIAYLQNDYDLKLVVTTEKETADAIPQYCKQHHIPYICVKTLKDNDVLKRLSSYHVSFAVLAYFGLIIPKSMIPLFPKGIINIHPSLLPAYRGTTPGQTAILLGETITGVTIMILDNEIDHGPILAREIEPIFPNDTAITLYMRLFTRGVALLQRVLPDYLSGKIQSQHQEHAKATYTKPLTRKSGFLADTQLVSPGLLERMIRAYFPWPGAWSRVTQLNESNLTGKIVKFLPQEYIQVEGKKPVSYRDFSNGYPEAKMWVKKFLS